MFSFHRPKVYRSSTGCCICKAKSSSSRFTDSKKYEEDFLECFQLVTPRQGEICNACVLLVKRWKKLPAGSDRNWRHVVDARAGPGIKSMTKVKSRNKRATESMEKNLKKKKSFEHECSPAPSDKSDGPVDGEIAEVDFFSESGPSSSRLSSLAASPIASDCEDNIGHSRRHKPIPKRRENYSDSDFIDVNYWKPKNVCCGVIFVGENNELLVDIRLWKPCNARKARYKHHMVQPLQVNGIIQDASVITKNYSDNSSDSGYDESSNPATAYNNAFKKVEQQIISELNSQLHHSNGN